MSLLSRTLCRGALGKWATPGSVFSSVRGSGATSRSLFSGCALPPDVPSPGPCGHESTLCPHALASSGQVLKMAKRLTLFAFRSPVTPVVTPTQGALPWCLKCCPCPLRHVLLSVSLVFHFPHRRCLSDFLPHPSCPSVLDSHQGPLL